MPNERFACWAFFLSKNMKYATTALFCLLLAAGLAQSPTRQTLNNHVQWINTSAKEVESIVQSFREAYDQTLRITRDKHSYALRYRCPFNDEPYYQQQAQKGNATPTLRTAADGYAAALAKVTQQCRALETYCTLETFKQDQYAGALDLITGLLPVLTEFEQRKTEYETAIEKTSPKKNAPADAHMRRIAALHRDLLAQLRYNFYEEAHTGWPLDQVQQHIKTFQTALDEVAAHPPKLDYPASGYYDSFLKCAKDALSTQKDYVDAYNYKNQESDQHANDFYRDMLNQYNGCLVPFYNQFTDATPGANLVKMTQTTPKCALIKTNTPPDTAVKTFRDAPLPTWQAQPQPKPIGTNAALALNAYLDVANTCARKNNYLLMVLNNNHLYYKPYPPTQNLYFNYDTHTLPRSLFADARYLSRHLPETYRAPLEALAQQLMDISVEMDDLRQYLVDFSREKRGQKEGYAAVERVRDRYVVLFEQFDQKKEALFATVETMYQSWPAANPGTSWQRSYAALTDVMRADKTLFTAAQTQFRQGTKPVTLSPDAVENAAVKSIQNQFENLKGIEKLGRYNGLCPYTPYEDIGTESRRLVEYARQPDKKKPTDFTYLYNEIVENYNRFVELSGQPLLKNTRQMDLFQPAPPPPPRSTTDVTKPAPPPATPPQTPVTADKKPSVQRDTVYIRDTIYLEKPPAVGAQFYSLEGFAPNNLVFLLDVSGSMNLENRLSLLQSSMSRLTQLLRREDEISVVSFSGKAKLLLAPTSGKKKERIAETIEELKSGGTTNIEEGLRLACQTARQNFKVGGNNRIILATDGDFSLSKAAIDLILEHAEAGITLSVFKFGSKPGQNLKTISDSGQGNLISITPENAEIFMIKEAQKRI